MPLFMKLQTPQRREKLILGGALSRRHGFLSTRMHHRNLRPRALATQKPSVVRQKASVTQKRRPQVPRKQAVNRKRLSNNHLPMSIRRRGMGTKQKAPNRQRGRTPSRRNQTVIHRKPPAKSFLKKLSNQAQDTIQQLSRSKPIKRALKSLGRDAVAVASATDLNHIGQRLLSSQAIPQPVRGRKRALDTSVDEPDSKHPRFISTTSNRIGYRGKTIQRGGTKQKCQKFLF